MVFISWSTFSKYEKTDFYSGGPFTVYVVGIQGGQSNELVKDF